MVSSYKNCWFWNIVNLQPSFGIFWFLNSVLLAKQNQGTTLETLARILTSTSEYTKILALLVVGQYPLLPCTIAAELKFPIVGPATHD